MENPIECAIGPKVARLSDMAWKFRAEFVVAAAMAAVYLSASSVVAPNIRSAAPVVAAASPRFAPVAIANCRVESDMARISCSLNPSLDNSICSCVTCDDVNMVLRPSSLALSIRLPICSGACPKIADSCAFALWNPVSVFQDPLIASKAILTPFTASAAAVKPLAKFPIELVTPPMILSESLIFEFISEALCDISLMPEEAF